MKVLLVRHAIATEREAPGAGGDGARPLTDKGRRRMERAAAGLAALLRRPDAIFTSPLVRALQTADILSAAWGGRPAPAISDLLAPGHGPLAQSRWLLGEGRHELIVLVGHMPGCANLLGHLCAGNTRLAVSFKKGGAALLETRPVGARLRATLLWLATPPLLQAISR